MTRFRRRLPVEPFAVHHLGGDAAPPIRMQRPQQTLMSFVHATAGLRRIRHFGSGRIQFAARPREGARQPHVFDQEVGTPGCPRHVDRAAQISESARARSQSSRANTVTPRRGNLRPYVPSSPAPAAISTASISCIRTRRPERRAIPISRPAILPPSAETPSGCEAEAQRNRHLTDQPVVAAQQQNDE